MSAPQAPATERNREPILAVLRQELGGPHRVLEIGSGTGQHAVFFARHLSGLTWQTSDRDENHAGIRAWIAKQGGKNVLPPLSLDVRRDKPCQKQYDAVFSANTAHIMSFDTVACMFRLVAECLDASGRFLLYGPFRIDGDFTSESNARFDESLRAQDPEMGIRDLEALDRLAAETGMKRERLYAMPANNFMAIWLKS